MARVVATFILNYWMEFTISEVIIFQSNHNNLE